MKNQRILIIASILLILCVFEKQARYKAVRGVTVEKMYSIPERSELDVPVYTQNEPNVSGENKSLYDPAQLLELVSSDTTYNNGFKLTDERSLDISSANTLSSY
ncbi:hypothetical protein DYBT9623_03860 [Dyadobacter sp. CECT 9623]|uniref:Uncharacterized protein n=1 Tax=Dyadobacter linearis TaxID=2823330 RepID=A0ABN7REB2_9BACT|nr:hypothetical protein [Dyadobacter sp. CECT 9623]CAG5071881.1 hypothetical protein DYBT9623_03860 [Dyadobacter sp. CECT 9623]